MKTIFRLFLALCFLPACKAQPVKPALVENSSEETLLWEISGKGIREPSYLFGTFHILCRDQIQFSEPLKEALHRSDEVWFEMDLDDPSNTLGAILVMNMKDGKKLKDLYTEAEFEKLNRFFTDSLGSSLAMFQRIKPMMLEALLFPKMLACKQVSGVEQELLAMAKNEKKEIGGLETIAQQSGFLDSIPYTVQAEILLKAIDSLQAQMPELNRMIALYQAQQISELERMMMEDSLESLGGQSHVLLDERNRNWVMQLEKIIPQKNLFIAVGAGHLPGKAGIIALLRKQGYTLRPLKNQ